VQFEAGETFEIGNFLVSAFAVQHDAIDPVGFIIVCNERKIGIATDLGTLNMLCRRHLSNCHALLLESNYDREMLYNSERRLHLKQRISGNIGHLDNQEAAQALECLLGDNTKFLMLVHVSSECNSPEIIENLTCNSLKCLQKEHIKTYIATQNNISDWFEI
jgi:phosphoribosyl 1,2-cyclic phosphodiesterase